MCFVLSYWLWQHTPPHATHVLYEAAYGNTTVAGEARGKLVDAL